MANNANIVQKMALALHPVMQENHERVSGAEMVSTKEEGEEGGDKEDNKEDDEEGGDKEGDDEGDKYSATLGKCLSCRVEPCNPNQQMCFDCNLGHRALDVGGDGAKKWVENERKRLCTVGIDAEEFAQYQEAIGNL